MKTNLFTGFEGRPEAKGWILPNGRLRPTRGLWHAQWLKQTPTVTTRYGIDLTGLDPFDDEQECRLRAIRAGLVRVRYDINGGQLGVELHKRHFDARRRLIKEPVRRAMIRLVTAIAPKLDNIRVHVLADNGRAVAVGRRALFEYDDRDKPKHLPLIEM